MNPNLICLWFRWCMCLLSRAFTSSRVRNTRAYTKKSGGEVNGKRKKTYAYSYIIYVYASSGYTCISYIDGQKARKSRKYSYKYIYYLYIGICLSYTHIFLHIHHMSVYEYKVQFHIQVFFRLLYLRGWAQHIHFVVLVKVTASRAHHTCALMLMRMYMSF